MVSSPSPPRPLRAQKAEVLVSAMLTGRLSLALDVLAAMFLFVVALLIVVGVIAAVASVFIGLDHFLSRIFELPREPRPWRFRQKTGRLRARFPVH
jgi:hypothetical protein